MWGIGLVGGRIAADSSGSFFWVWQNIALCTISTFSLILAVRCLWDPEWGQSGSPTTNVGRPSGDILEAPSEAEE